MFKIHDMLDGPSVWEVFEKNEKKGKSTARQLKTPKKVRVHMRIK